MALVKCKECGQEVSDMAEACPHCGYPLTEMTYYHQPPQVSKIGYLDNSCIEESKHERKAREKAEKKAEKKAKAKHMKDSSLSIAACALAGIVFILPLPMLISYPLAILTLVLGLVDLGCGNKEERHVGSGFAIVIALILIVMNIDYLLKLQALLKIFS